MKLQNRMCSVLALLAAINLVSASVPLNDFYAFGLENGDSKVPAVLDGYAGPISLANGFPFFNETYNNVYVSTHGVISFRKGYLQFTPDCGALDFESTMITPFWADIDIRNEGAIYYRETSDPVLLEKAAGEIQKTFPNPKDLFLSFMFVTTFDRVTFYRACTSNITNTFQAIFTSDGTRSFTIFNYNDITWTTGPDSGGDCSTGLGGSPAKTGFDVGDGITFFEIPGSCSDEIIELEETTNVNEPGKWIFRVDNSLESPEIEPILTCSPILPLENGYFEVDNFTVGSYAVFYCNEPFILVGESSITCTDEAVWSADAPVCTAATAEFTCTDPPGTSSYHKDVEDCTKYYVCEGTRKHHMPCPAPLVFNPQWNVCDWKANVEGC